MLEALAAHLDKFGLALTSARICRRFEKLGKKSHCRKLDVSVVKVFRFRNQVIKSMDSIPAMQDHAGVARMKYVD